MCSYKLLYTLFICSGMIMMTIAVTLQGGRRIAYFQQSPYVAAPGRTTLRKFEDQLQPTVSECEVLANISMKTFSLSTFCSILSIFAVISILKKGTFLFYWMVLFLTVESCHKRVAKRPDNQIGCVGYKGF